MRFSQSGGSLRATPLSHTGIGIAGDAFDYRIVDKVVSPQLGKGGSYRSMGKVLTLPNRHYANLARWNQLAMMKGSGDLQELKDLAKDALDPEPLQKFIDIIEYDLGFALYRAVSAAKVALSVEDETEFRFEAEGIDIRATVTRAAFEGWIAEDVARIEATLDDALAQAGIAARDIDRVFLTGGTSFVPAIRRRFEERFGTERLTSGHQFASNRLWARPGRTKRGLGRLGGRGGGLTQRRFAIGAQRRRRLLRHAPVATGRGACRPPKAPSTVVTIRDRRPASPRWFERRRAARGAVHTNPRGQACHRGPVHRDAGRKTPS